MRIGFTGTRNGITEEQRLSFIRLLDELKPTHFAHGDCVGSDDQAALLVVALVAGVRVICHPPVDVGLRAFNAVHDEVREPKTHFARNRVIVDESDAMVATPREMSHMAFGGTWYTVDYARKRGKPVYVIFPDGSVERPEGVV